MIQGMNRRAMMLLLGSVAMGMTMLGGCEKQLFPEDVPRSPYARYDTLRGRHRAAQQENAYGGTQPALRERLRPMGEP
jgi:hypothetical protein